MNFPFAKGTYRKLARVIAFVLCITALAIWFFHLYVWHQYDGTRPVKPDVSSGRVFEQNTHGHVVHLAKEEDAWLTRLTLLFVSLFGTGFLVNGLFAEGFHWRKSPAPWERNNGEPKSFHLVKRYRSIWISSFRLRELIGR
jgi:hypothetical protein